MTVILAVRNEGDTLKLAVLMAVQNDGGIGGTRCGYVKVRNGDDGIDKKKKKSSDIGSAMWLSNVERR